MPLQHASMLPALMPVAVPAETARDVAPPAQPDPQDASGQPLATSGLPSQGATPSPVDAASPADLTVERRRATATARLLHVWLTLVTAASVVFHAGPEGSPTARIITAVVAALCFVLAQLRERRSRSIARLSSLGQLIYRVRAIAVGGVLLAAASFLVPGLLLTPGLVLATAVAVLVVGATWSLVTRSWLGARRLQRVLLVGDGPAVARLVEAFADDPHPEYALAGHLSADTAGTGTLPGVPRLGEVADVDEVIVDHAIDVVVVGVESGRLELFARLADLEAPGISVQELSAFSEDAFGKVPVELINAAWFMYMIHPFYRPYSRAAKRAADILMSLAIGLAALPLVPLVALAVRLSGPGPVLFRQVRVGEGGREFTLYKFRSMVVDAEAGGARWATRDDPRITRVGSFIRATRLDEIPQLWNILRGQMSFVGPRPERPEFVADLESAIPYYRRRHLVKPGLTGWAQVRLEYTDSVDGAASKLGFELYYLKHQSLIFDLVIFLETVRVVLLRFGSR